MKGQYFSSLEELIDYKLESINDETFCELMKVGANEGFIDTIKNGIVKAIEFIKGIFKSILAFFGIGKKEGGGPTTPQMQKLESIIKNPSLKVIIGEGKLAEEAAVKKALADHEAASKGELNYETLEKTFEIEETLLKTVHDLLKTKPTTFEVPGNQLKVLSGTKGTYDTLALTTKASRAFNGVANIVIANALANAAIAEKLTVPQVDMDDAALIKEISRNRPRIKSQTVRSGGIDYVLREDDIKIKLGRKTYKFQRFDFERRVINTIKPGTKIDLSTPGVISNNIGVILDEFKKTYEDLVELTETMKPIIEDSDSMNESLKKVHTPEEIENTVGRSRAFLSALRTILNDHMKIMDVYLELIEDCQDIGNLELMAYVATYKNENKD